MPYLPTSQEYLEQSALLIEAYPDTRITTKYSFPKPFSKSSSQKPQQEQPTQQPPQTPIATLTLKTYTPTSGICLKYSTDKVAEVGRLMTSLGKLAAGADVAALGLSAPVPAAGDVEMVDVMEEGAAAPAGAGATPATNANAGAKGKSKKKGGKGKK